MIPLLLIPGFLSDETVWQDQKETLSDIADITIADLSNCDTVDKMIDAAMKNMPEKFALAGHSMGGFIALEIALRYPERVSKLCILSTSATDDTEVMRERRLSIINNPDENNINNVIETVTEKFIHCNISREKTKAMFLKNKKEIINHSKAMLNRTSCLEKLSSINIPTWVIIGENDQTFYQSTVEIANNIPNTHLEIIQNCGHMLTFEQPEKISALMMEWLNA